MKVLSGLMFFVLLGIHANAQHDAKVIAEIAHGNEKMVKNAPFSAEAVSESGRRDAEAHDVRKGIQFLAERRLLPVPAGDFAVGDVEDQRQRQ